MTKLLEADWLREIQLFHELYSSTINDFPKINKMAAKEFACKHDHCGGTKSRKDKRNTGQTAKVQKLNQDYFLAGNYVAGVQTYV